VYHINFFLLEMKNGHYPKNVLRYKSWTAEDWQKFTFPAAELIFADVVDSGEYELIWLTARMVELLFHFRDGLKSKDLTLLKNICWRRLIMLEETVGAEQCVITCHNTIHIAEDILRFGHCDNFWCFHNERAVQRYFTHKKSMLCKMKEVYILDFYFIVKKTL